MKLLSIIRHFLVFCLIAISATRARAAESYIAITAAYRPEITAIHKAFGSGKSPTKKKILGITFATLDYKGKKLLIFETGMSLTNAAMSTQIALDHFPIESVLFAGIAGGINPNLLPGDVTIPGRWIYHGEAAYFNQKPDGKFEVATYFKAKYPNFGYQFPDDVTVLREGMSRPTRKAYFPADPHLLSLAKRAVKTMPPLTAGGRKINLKIGGPGVSGTVFMDNADYRQWVWKTWRADCLDMESTSMAHVCWINRKPCLIVRALSDLAGGQKGLNQIDNFETISSDNAAAVLKAVVDRME